MKAIVNIGQHRFIKKKFSKRAHQFSKRTNGRLRYRYQHKSGLIVEQQKPLKLKTFKIYNEFLEFQYKKAYEDLLCDWNGFLSTENHQIF